MLLTVKSKVKISQNFVAFSEYMSLIDLGIHSGYLFPPFYLMNIDINFCICRITSEIVMDWIQPNQVGKAQREPDITIMGIIIIHNIITRNNNKSRAQNMLWILIFHKIRRWRHTKTTDITSNPNPPAVTLAPRLNGWHLKGFPTNTINILVSILVMQVGISCS